VADVVQDALIRYQAAAPGSIRNPEAWITRVTRNRCLDVLDGHRRHRPEPLDWVADVLERMGPQAPGSSWQAGDRLLLAEVLGSLAPRSRRVLVMHLLGWSNAEIAEELGYASAATVAARVSRIKKRLRDQAVERGWVRHGSLRPAG
jgi:RNA polymerase sigma factor (sigma-70 family)